MIVARTSRTARATLMASVAGLCLSLAATPAYADDDPPADGAISRPDAAEVVREAQDGGGYRIDRVPAEPQIVIANPNTTVSDRDPTNITGVGQMVVDTGGGFIGLCTATLINPRTVIFAAHCVNDEAANAYGSNTGGTPIGFGFSNANLAGLQGWYFGGNHTNEAQAFYNSNYVSYNPASLEPAANGFLYGDVAVASLDTPAQDIPTWAMLLSPLPSQPITPESGAGYHVSLIGYGNNGTAATGSTGGIDFRRRLAENFIGGLASLDQFENFLFGGAASANPQNLYWIDFDDPARSASNPGNAFDFNAWRDNAVPPNATGNSQEGITASGDSGGPLVLDNTFSRQFVLGVLSGGYTRFFTGQPANGYGTASFYQPLYLYWDWIAANNPYHYVSATAGDGNWTDPTHWVTNLDPNYYILDGGQPVNGIPTTAGGGPTDNSNTWGEACFQSGGVSQCQDMSPGGGTTTEFIPKGGPYPPSAIVGTDYGTVTADSLGGADGQGTQLVSRVAAEAQSGGGQGPQLAPPAATLDNGLPGATNFVPNNWDGNRFTSEKPRYFDVTLWANGTTTLDTAVTVDRFTMAGGGARLNVATGGTLTSLMDISQLTGTVQVNGLIATPGDYLLVSGGLNGSGTVRSAYFTNMLGTIAPGTAGTVGTLTFDGNLILTSGSKLMIDLRPNGVSDRVLVTGANAGMASLGGQLLFGWDASLRGEQTYTILSTQNGISGTFNTPAPFSAILSPKVIYSAKNVQVYIEAGLYRNLFNQGTDPSGYAWAQILDQNRKAAGRYDGLYGPLDLQNAATIRATLDSMAPATETTIQMLGIAGLETSGNFIRDRLASLDMDSLGGTVAHYGAPMQMASLGRNNIGFGPEITPGAGAAPQYTTEGALPETMSAFVAGGYINGDSSPMLLTGATGRDDFDGWYAAGGVEGAAGDGVVGLAFSYTKLDADASFGAQSAKGTFYQLNLYGKVPVGALTLDTQMSAAIYNAKTRRDISFLGTPYTLRSSDNALATSAEVGLGKAIDAGGVRITPRVAGRLTNIQFSPTAESGGPMALTYDRGNIRSEQLRGGLTIEGTGAKFKPYLNGTWIHDFEGRPGYVGANLVGGILGNAAFLTNLADKNYGEVSGGLTYHAGNIDVSVSAMSTVARSDLSVQQYRGSLAFHF